MIVRGILLAILLAITTIGIAALLLFILQRLGLPPRAEWAFSAAVILNAAVYFIGITQLLYIIPLVVVFWRQRRFASMKGLIIGAVLVGLIDLAFLSYLVNQFR
ncbi:hypothetical protein NIES2104_14690 [Leptolyngbya sp. NIES-2104]|nr:hypothetical protein NIES2104_14690 [Leptolyngbya sp. NIES-2104]